MNIAGFIDPKRFTNRTTVSNPEREGVVGETVGFPTFPTSLPWFHRNISDTPFVSIAISKTLNTHQIKHPPSLIHFGRIVSICRFENLHNLRLVLIHLMEPRIQCFRILLAVDNFYIGNDQIVIEMREQVHRRKQGAAAPLRPPTPEREGWEGNRRFPPVVQT